MRYKFFCALLFASTVCVGCGGDGTTLVSGKVTLDGAPLANAKVSFDSAKGQGRPAMGTTDGEGKFTLTTIKPNDGALPGDYTVTVSKVAAPMDFKGKDPKDMFKNLGKTGAEKDTSGIHPNYSEFSKSPLKVTVPVKGELVLALKKDGT